MSSLEEDRHCGKEQDGEALQPLSYSNPVSLNNVDLVFSKGSFYVIELLICGVSGSPSATECWPSIDWDISSIIGVLSKRVLHVLDFSVPIHSAPGHLQKGSTLKRWGHQWGTLSAGSGDPIRLNSEFSRQVDTLQCQSEQAADIGDEIGVVTSGVSSVRRQIVSVVPRHCRQPVRGGVTRTVRGPPSKWRSPVVWEVLSGSMAWAPVVNCPGYAVGSASTVNTWPFNEVP
ncbi:hypothetical protein TIFTF001_013463 [Ficus carica]|uniref:Uncharacterized protein n=1 Tax=Ficus carica TaxID=3494 RepID=A0AA88AHW1_FICCA|nr:hypothetical protein TIFTF001_013463 [Ficus carica]